MLERDNSISNNVVNAEVFSRPTQPEQKFVREFHSVQNWDTILPSVTTLENTVDSSELPRNKPDYAATCHDVKLKS